jgi:hypothetical protein
MYALRDDARASSVLVSFLTFQTGTGWSLLRILVPQSGKSLKQAARHGDIPRGVRYAHGCLAPPLFVCIGHATQKWTEIRMCESLVV